MPGARRDLSLVLDPDDTLESLGDRVRLSLAREVGVVESVEILSETSYEELPDSARRRMGVRPGQRNVLVRVLLRAYDRTLTTEECNHLRDRIYAALHRGERSEWATRP
jgi:phenylalanyl-tRNA synthetase alpha chain